MNDRRYCFVSHHCKLLVCDIQVGLRQSRSLTDALLLVDNEGVFLNDLTIGIEMCLEQSGEMIRSGTSVFLRQGAKYFSAQQDGRVENNRDSVQDWERFFLLELEDAPFFLKSYVKPENEMHRFAQAVESRKANGSPVLLHFGCGKDPRQAFLNIDYAMWSPACALRNPHTYFLFPFADRHWEIADETVDYIFHEDFIEHISQLQQIQFLAEAFRVMKVGAYHRVNTPNLITTMKVHSNFREGFLGVYTGELHWGHTAILSPRHLEEIAKMIGYREVVFTTKHCGVSPYAERDLRPAGDRDDITGNIYADLMK